ncbi:hypothetical protein QBC39DRAFT_357180 [Podospora conica]|nr:hypothetical protein QBC39DRAFT_357180 [Schizothecium conicum]
MEDAELLRALAAATPAEAARILKGNFVDRNDQILTPKLLAAVDDGAIPPAVFVIYLGISRCLGTLWASLWSRSSTIRDGAIKHVGKLLRSEQDFDKAWNAFGAAPGIAALMRSLSLDDVDRLCRALGKDLSASKFSSAALAKRQQAVSQLLDLLSPLDPSRPTVSDPLPLVHDPRPFEDLYAHFIPACTEQARDPRPLDHLYAHLVPACTEQAREQWWIKQNPGKQMPKPSLPYPQWLEPGQEAKFHADIDLGSQKYKIDGMKWLLNHERKPLVDIAQCIAKADVQDLEIKPAVFFHANILSPAVRTLSRKKWPPGTHTHIWDMIASSFVRWPLMAEQLDFSRGGLIRLAISRWVYAPTKESHARAGDILCDLLKLVPSTKVPSMQEWFQLGLFDMKPQHNYQLLLWLFRMTKRFSVNIEAPTDQDKECLKGIQDFPIELFRDGLMPPEKAMDLLHLLIEIRPDRAFLKPATPPSYPAATIFSIRQSLNIPLPCGDFETLHYHLLTHLSPDHPKRTSANVDITSVVEAIKLRKDKAAKGRTSEDRLFWAQSALFLAISTGSLDLYSQTLAWARRFDRDWETLRGLYEHETVLTKEGIELLSGIPSRSQLALVSLSAITTAMSAAGQVVSQILETAAANIREPTFSPSNWSCLSDLIQNIVKCRLRRVEALQEYFGLPDDEVYAIVWKPTMDMLLSTERFALKDENMALPLANRAGFLPTLDHQDLCDHVWSFLDNLAKGRDELWQKERSRRYPAVLTLPPPWPKGLPVQDLLNHQQKFDKVSLKMPYVVSRAEAVLFGSPEILLSPMPSDVEFKEAVGGFFDDYKACFHIYIHGWPGPDGLSREERVARVWQYATTKLTGSIMAKDEARAFWQAHVFGPLQDWLPTPPEPLPPKLPGPVFPRTQSPSEPAEWDPDPALRSKGSTRTLEGPVTCLDIIVTSPGYLASMPLGESVDISSVTKPVVQTSPTPSFWDLDQYERPLSGESQDAFIAAAILSINSKGGSGDLLMEPFPAPTIARFPAVYLGDEFLEEMYSPPKSSTILELLRHAIHPALLLRLATALRKRVELMEVDYITWEERQAAFRVIKLLARCDQPGIARDLIRDIVLDTQAMSSWHRHLFSKGFFSRLPADEAKQFLESIADAMIQRLKDQAKRKDDGVNQESATGSQPAIKVTTVKMLAEILRGAKFVGHGAAYSTLGRILENARHIDIRIAVIQSLVDLFLSSRDAIEIQTGIFDILKAHAVPIAASLSEREGPMSEDTWASAEEKGSLSLDWDGEREVDALLRGVQDSQLSPDWRPRWAKEILGEATVQSTKNQARWQGLFLKVNNLSLPEGEEIPVMAASMSLQLELLKYRPQYLNRTDFDHLVKLTMVNLEPGPKLDAINSKIRTQPGLKESLDGAIWLSRYGRGGSSVFGLGVRDAAALLYRPSSFWLSTPKEGGITVQLIQDFVYAVADSFIRKSDLYNLNKLIQQLNRVDSDGSYNVDRHTAWEANTVPLLKRIIARIDELRTPEWQHNPKRDPSRLPETFGIRVKLLPFPPNRSHSNDSPPSDDEIEVFAEALKAFITELANRGTPLQADWVALRAAATQVPGSQPEFLRVALALTEDIVPTLEKEGGRQPNLAECLRVELAVEMIRLAQDPKDDSVIWRVWDMTNEYWALSPVEFLRDHARTTVENVMLAEKKKGTKFWERITKKALARNKGLLGEGGGIGDVEVEEVSGDYEQERSDAWFTGKRLGVGSWEY